MTPHVSCFVLDFILVLDTPREIYILQHVLFGMHRMSYFEAESKRSYMSRSMQHLSWTIHSMSSQCITCVRTQTNMQRTRQQQKTRFRLPTPVVVTALFAGLTGSASAPWLGRYSCCPSCPGLGRRRLFGAGGVKILRSQDFHICLRCFCGVLRRMQFPTCKRTNKYCGDLRSASTKHKSAPEEKCPQCLSLL